MSAVSAVQWLADFPASIDGEVNEDAERWSFGECAHVLNAIRRCRSDLAIAEKRVEHLAVEAAGNRRSIQVEGLGMVDVKTDVKHNGWKHEDLIRVVVARALDERIVDGATGEYEPAHEAVARVLTACGHIDYWRKGELAQRGLDIDEFSHATFGEKKIRLP